MVRLALVGFGGYGWGLVQVINQVAERVGCRLVAAADAHLPVLGEKADALARAGVALFDDALAMFDALSGKCDAVYIATGIPSHAPLTIAAAQAGYHVHLEKPPAATVQEVDAMLAALDAAGRCCIVGFQALHDADIRFVKERVVAGRLGRVKTLVCHAGWPRNRAYYTRNEWAGRLRVGDAWVLDGPAMNALAHQVTNMLFLASPEPGRLATPTAVRAELYAAGDAESHDTAAIEIHTAEGPMCLFLASHCSETNFGPVIELDAERGHVHWTMREGARIVLADGTEETCPASDGRAEMIGNLVEAVRRNDGSVLRCPLSETRKFVLALDGAHESSGRIHRIGLEHVRKVGEGAEARTIVPGLDALLVQAARGKCLFGELPEAPAWATPCGAFDVAEYRCFPRRFAGGAAREGAQR
ncbi:MAG TPA: Gfo/Idh/MocA family oxidoreductase [Planctomycetota bacterium]|nr:Gfo/Idh/MocA family oxidoreductase [Planctomycetota bacterium]